MPNRLTRIKNYFFPTDGQGTLYKKPVTSKDTQRNLTNYISPVQFARIRQDILLWRDAIKEAEMAYYPQRIKMQRLYQDTIINPQVAAVMDRRKDLTLLRDFKIATADGTESEYLKKIFRDYTKTPATIEQNNSCWFDDFIENTLDAMFFGYTLISLGDVVNDSFPDLSIIRRQNVSPDRLNVTSFVYALSGADFTKDPYVDWHVYVPTRSTLGVSPCGYGLLYTMGMIEIYLRNNVGFNADYIELYGQPLRVGKTMKTEEAERAAFARDLQNMGSSPWIVLDEGSDTIELVETNTKGTGYNSYDNFEKRLEAKLSKLVLGHADALDSVPGKLGAGSGEDNPVSKALMDKQTKDGTFVQNIINGQLIPRMRKLGFKIPLEYSFQFTNNDEVEQQREREDESNTKTATLFKTIVDAGGKPDWKYFTDRTGIPVEEKPEPIPPVINPLVPGNDNGVPVPGAKEIAVAATAEPVKKNGKPKPVESE